MQETWVWSLIREDLTCLKQLKPVHHNYWTSAQQQEKPPQGEARAPQLEKSATRCD